MILPMKKVSCIVMDKDREQSLKKLRELGVVHLVKKTVSSDALSRLLERKAKTESALRYLRPYEKTVKTQAKETKSSGRNTWPLEAAAEYTADMPDIVSRILLCADEQKGLQSRLAQLNKERGRLEEWGDFNPGDIAFLAEKGKLNLFLYKLPIRAFGGLQEEVRFIKMGEDKKSVRLLVFDKALSGKPPLNPGKYSRTEMDSLISGVRDQMADVERQFSVLAQDKDSVEKELKTLLAQIEFEIAREKMNVLENVPAESTVSWISGFVPKEDLGLLKRNASENGWALAAEDPGPDDLVPTKLKNNRLVSLLNPLTGFLDILPGYHEVDISGWFLLFFTIFFGMIFGDAAYGAIFVVLAIVGILKNLKTGVHPALKLLLLLGSSNFIWGVLTCTWFGLAPAQIPLVLQKISLPLISNVTAVKSAYDDGIVRQNMMIICFSIALLQLSIGHIIAILHNKTLKSLADIGAIAMLMGMYGVVLSLIAGNEYRRIPLFMPCVYLLGGGFILNTVFVNYKGSIGKSILESLKNFISTILGITNVFSDIMSYLRLWAVGLAGSAIASIVITMAGPLLGNFFFFILGVILLVFGHGLNLVLNTLSVLVHGVRLNTLEFSGRIGLTWAGTAYKPFKESV